MAKGLNQCSFIGNLGQDPEVRYTQSNVAVASFSIAVNESWKSKDTGETTEHTEWVRCVAWRRLGEVIGEYLKKGSKVFVQGRMQTRKWQDNDGNDRYTTEIVVNDMMMLDSRGQGGGDQQQRPAQQPAAQPQSGGYVDHTRPGQDQHQQAKQNGYQPDRFDDDIPF